MIKRPKIKTGYLLDTHIILWLTTNDKNLKVTSSEIINKHGGIISMVSLWEAAIKFSIGKLRLAGGFNLFLSAVNNLDFERIGIRDTHLKTLEKLPSFQNHKDPFDRLLIAQAEAEGLNIITSDEQFKKYNIPLVFN